MRDTFFRICKLLTVVLVAVSSFPLIGQSASPAQASAAVAADMRPVTGELQGKLDSKTAKVGDSVALKTRAEVKAADGTVIPKGARLVGHVTSVQAHESGDVEGRLGLLFDHAELKGGQSVAIVSAILALEPPVTMANASPAGADDSFGTGQAGGQANGLGQASSSGRPGGGGVFGGPASAGGHVDPSLTSGIEDTTRAPGRAAVAPTANAGSSVHDVAGISGGVVAHARKVPGVALAGSGCGAISGMLFAAKRNVHLDGGTQLVLGVSTGTQVR